MVRLWLVNEDGGAAYPVCNPFDAEEISAEMQRAINAPNLEQIFDVVRTNLPSKFLAMSQDDKSGKPSPGMLAVVDGL